MLKHTRGKGIEQARSRGAPQRHCFERFLCRANIRVVLWLYVDSVCDLEYCLPCHTIMLGRDRTEAEDR